MPQSVVKRFVYSIGTAVSHHTELVHAAQSRPRHAALKGMLAEQFAMRVIVQWEAFIHDLIIAYIARDPSKCLSNSGIKIRKSVTDRFGAVAAGRTTFSEALPLDRVGAQGLIDPRGKNVKATSADLLASVANENLSAQQARKFSLNAVDGQFVDFTTALRNYIAHRSARSWKELVQVKKALTGAANLPFGGSMSPIGAYLRSPNHDLHSRAICLAKRLADIANKLR
ncbi:MAG TPA: hypothetical protein VNK24_05735 [Elusimicrobiota bacterium]|nr:hypothetical protein [Elusimicrobiota bacterium]